MRPRVMWPAGVALLAAACASEGPPPGGPPDHTPPVLVESQPADRAVNATPDQAIHLKFDEVVDERQSARLTDLILVNPDTPTFDPTLDGDQIVLDPRTPMIDGMTYSVTILPGLSDRDGNRTTRAKTILFSVGGETPITLSLVRATIVQDTMPAAGAHYVLADSADELTYRFVADSQGLVQAEGVAYGAYVATAWLEQVRPEGWQTTEEPGDRDTFELSSGNRSHEAFYRLTVRDTTPPLVVSVEAVDSRTLRVKTDDALVEEGPASSAIRVWQGPPSADFADVAPDSIPLDRVRARPIRVLSVDRIGPREFRLGLAAPLVKGRYDRVELVGVENVDGLASTATGGLTFVADYAGPEVRPSEPIEWPSGEP